MGRLNRRLTPLQRKLVKSKAARAMVNEWYKGETGRMPSSGFLSELFLTTIAECSSDEEIYDILYRLLKCSRGKEREEIEKILKLK